MSYKYRHPGVSEEDILNHYLNTDLRGKFSKMCKQANINYDTALEYRKRHDNITDEQVILHYNPYCYYNIQGEFIIVPLPKSKGDTND